MRSFTLSVALGALLLVLTPQPAHAWFAWLDYLSGPGPFIGDSVELRLWCFWPESPKTTGDSDSSDPNKDPKKQEQELSKNRSSTGVILESGCLNGRKPFRHQLSVNLIAGASWALNNELNYEQLHANRRIGIINTGVLVSYAVLHRVIEFKGGVEENYFWGPAFTNFSHISIPVLIDFKPLAVIRGIRNTDSVDDWLDKLTLRVGREYFPVGFDSADFGAIPHQFTTSHEWLWTFGLVIDMGGRR